MKNEKLSEILKNNRNKSPNNSDMDDYSKLAENLEMRIKELESERSQKDLEQQIKGIRDMLKIVPYNEGSWSYTETRLLFYVQKKEHILKKIKGDKE